MKMSDEDLETIASLSEELILTMLVDEMFTQAICSIKFSSVPGEWEFTISKVSPNEKQSYKEPKKNKTKS